MSEGNTRSSSVRMEWLPGVRERRLRSGSVGLWVGMLMRAGPRKMAFSTLAATRWTVERRADRAPRRIENLIMTAVILHRLGME